VTEERCHCGRPLHYRVPEIEQAMRRLVERFGPNVVVETPDGRWRVPRHYIALHGLKASELPTLGFEVVEESADALPELQVRRPDVAAPLDLPAAERTRGV